MKIIVPISVLIPRKTKADKKIALNLNCYRNLHHITNNQAKIIFKQHLSGLMTDTITAWVGNPPYRFTYTLYQSTRRSIDIANVLSVVDKFTCDALVEIGCIEDDDYSIVTEIVYRYGGVDKQNPRAELQITKI